MNVAESMQSLNERSEERGGVSRDHSNFKKNDTIWLALKRAIFDTKKGVFYTTNEKF